MCHGGSTAPRPRSASAASRLRPPPLLCLTARRMVRPGHHLMMPRLCCHLLKPNILFCLPCRQVPHSAVGGGDAAAAQHRGGALRARGHVLASVWAPPGGRYLLCAARHDCRHLPPVRPGADHRRARPHAWRQCLQRVCMNNLSVTA